MTVYIFENNFLLPLIANDLQIYIIAPVIDCCKLEDVEADDDRRWQPLRENFEFPKTKSEREHMLRELTRPFLHDMHTWYTKNKPTKSIIPLKHSGKRPKPEWRFSHL